MESINHTPFIQHKRFKKAGLLTLFIFLFTSQRALAQEWNWAVSGGDGGNQDKVLDIETDSDSNVYIVGTFWGSEVVIGNQVINTQGHKCGYVAKYDRFHNFIWVRTVNSSFDETEIKGIAIDPANQLYVIGTTTGDASFGNNVTLEASYDNPDIFVAKFDNNGNALWAKLIGCRPYTDYAGKITTDKHGFIYVCGTLSSFNDDHGFIDTNELIYDGRNIFLVKFDSSGNIIWFRNTPNSTPQGDGLREANALAVVNNDIYLTGQISRPTTFGTTTIGSGTQTFAYLAKYDTEGNLKFAETYSGGGTYPYDIAADSLNNVFIAARLKGNLYWENDTASSAGWENNDALIMCFDSLGNKKWYVLSGDTENDLATGVSADGLGNAYITGHFTDSIHFMGIHQFMGNTVE